MSLSDLHEHLLLFTRKHKTRAGSSILKGWSRSDEVHAQAVLYFQSVIGGSRYNFDRLALSACQDLVNLRVISLQDATQYKVFRKSPQNFVYLHSIAPKRNIQTRSGLRWWSLNIQPVLDLYH